MPNIVAGLFDGLIPANRAVQALERAGIDSSKVVLLKSESTGEYARRTANQTANILAGTAGAAGFAGVAGLLLELATVDNDDDTLRTLADFELPPAEAESFTHAIRDGKVLIIVEANDLQVGKAQTVLDHSSSGSRTYANGLALTIQKNAMRGLESDYRRDFDVRFDQSGYTYRQFAPAYHYGRQLAKDEVFHGKEWNVIEASAYRQWEQENPNTWEQVKDAVKQGFLRG